MFFFVGYNPLILTIDPNFLGHPLPRLWNGSPELKLQQTLGNSPAVGTGPAFEKRKTSHLVLYVLHMEFSWVSSQNYWTPSNNRTYQIKYSSVISRVKGDMLNFMQFLCTLFCSLKSFSLMGEWKNPKKSTKTWNHKVLLMEEILPSIGLSWPITKPPFGSWAVYFHHSVKCVSVDKNSLNWGNICKPKTPRLLVQISSKRKHKNSVHHPALEDKSVRHFVHIRRKNICLVVSWATQSTIQSPITTNLDASGRTSSETICNSWESMLDNWWRNFEGIRADI